MQPSDLQPGVIVCGSVLPEAVEVLAAIAQGSHTRLIGKGIDSGQVYEPTLTNQDLLSLSALPRQTFDGDAQRFRLGVEARRLGLAYEYDPYFSLSIARVDPLPHQLEAVYDYFLKLPRIRFLLADDPGAGKTIMAGLLLKELKARGLVRRVLIVSPANLMFQWQREMKDRFRERFDIIRGDVLRAQYGSNPWQESDQVVTSVSWVSRIEEARDSLLRSRWDLIVVDEAHKMSAADESHKTLAFRIGEELSDRTDHLLLMTATPHKGDPDHFRLFLSLLDRDVYADVASLEEAMRRNSAPFYLRRTKEALVSFPDPVTGLAEKLFRAREVRTVEFELSPDESEFYEALTNYVETQSIRGSADDSARGRALRFSMAMLQRRFASSTYAARRSLERMRDKREKIIADPEAYRQEQISKRLPGDFDDLPDEDRQKILDDMEAVVASVDPAALREEIVELQKLIKRAVALEDLGIESKWTKLLQTLDEQGIRTNAERKLLVFTEHKDTLDYLVAKLRGERLTVTTIHGGMPIGDRDQQGSRLSAEREFREAAQVMVATEAAGEGINLQFCAFMVNYDIPWNPVRLEQRMGRIHRYGQTRDCLILNFVAHNTREGRVLQKLLERLMEIRKDLGTDQVFDVVGEVFPANQLERMLRELYARQTSEKEITNRIAQQVDVERIRHITESALEGLAKREINLVALTGRSIEARERRLVPEAVEDFFLSAAPVAGLSPKPARANPRVYSVGRLPGALERIGEEQEPKFGRLGKTYAQIVFDKGLLDDVPTAEWITPGHALFEAVRHHAQSLAQDDLRRGAVLYDINAASPYCLDVFVGAIRDGRGHCLHQTLRVVLQDALGSPQLRQPTIFQELAPAPSSAAPSPLPALPTPQAAEAFLLEQALVPLLGEVQAERTREATVVAEHLKLSLDTIIDRTQTQLMDLEEKREAGSTEAGLDGRIVMLEDRLSDLNRRRDTRIAELEQERYCTIASIEHLGRALVLPHPDRKTPTIAPMVRDDEVERVAVKAAIAHEEARGCRVESVESQNRGFDLISRRPHPEDPATSIEVRFIEVKGRSGVGEVALSRNEYNTSRRLQQDYWLYVVFNCGSAPDINTIQDPARLGWVPVSTVEHYHLGPAELKVGSGS